MSELHRKILAILFASGEPISPERIAEAIGATCEDVSKLVVTLGDWLQELMMPFEVLTISGQYQLASRREYAQVIMSALNTRRSAPLTQASLEVLAIIAYNQPVTRAFIEQVRGVDSSSIVASLSAKGLICEVDRLDIPGRPIAFGTTPLFMRTFGISSISELPDPHGFAEQALRQDEPELSDEGALGDGDTQIEFDV